MWQVLRKSAWVWSKVLISEAEKHKRTSRDWVNEFSLDVWSHYIWIETRNWGVNKSCSIWIWKDYLRRGLSFNNWANRLRLIVMKCFSQFKHKKYQNSTCYIWYKIKIIGVAFRDYLIYNSVFLLIILWLV